MNPIQLQLQSEAALPQNQLKDAGRTEKSSALSFESELNKASEEASKRSEKPEQVSGASVSERPEDVDGEKIAKNMPKKDSEAEDSENKAEDISGKIQQIQISSENQRKEVPTELPKAYEDFVVDFDKSCDSNAELLVSSKLLKEAQVSDENFDFDVSEIDMEEILSKAKIIDEKSEKSANMAESEVKNIQSLAKSELGLDEVALSEIDLSAGELKMPFAENTSEAPVFSGAFDGVKVAQKNPEAAEKDNKSDKLSKLTVHDLRTKKPSKTDVPSDKAVQKTESAKTDMKITQQVSDNNSVQMSIELASKTSAEQNITSSSSQAAGSNGSTFQAMLSNAVQANAPEIVKMGNIVLKDKNSGSINLILKPENLGSVKISLNLSDKLISGQITVSSREAMDAFRDSIESIRQAFVDGGFETGAFDLNFSQEGGFAQNANDGGNRDFANQISGGKKYGELVSDLSGSSEAGSFGNFSDSSVNIVA